MKFWFGLYSWLFSISWNDTKVVFFTKTWEKLEFVICAKMVRVFFKKWTTFHSYDSRIKINNNICRYRHTLKMLGIVFSIYICTLHRISSKNFDLNICVCTWHSVSVMGHKQGFDLACCTWINSWNTSLVRNWFLGCTLSTCSAYSWFL